MSVAALGVAGTIAAGTVLTGAVAGMDSSRRAANTQGDAIRSQEKSSDKQLALSQEQWDFNKNVYLPKSMKLADDAAALNKTVAQKQMDASDYYMGVSKDAVAQAKKSYEFQDRYMKTARDYSDGTMGNTMADEAGADVQRAGGLQRGATEREMLRRGIDPSSGAGMALMRDDELGLAAVGAGAQTAARRAARDKAEQMVGIAAGSGAAGFGTGLSAGGLATGANTAASGASTVGSATLNGTNAGFTAGNTGAAGAAFGAGRIGNGLGNSYNGNPFADQIGAIAGGALKSGAFNGIGTGLRNIGAGSTTPGVGYGTWGTNDNYGDGYGPG